MTSLMTRKCYETGTFHSFTVPLTPIGCLETNVITVYCVAFYCNANSRKNKRSQLCFKKKQTSTDEAQSFARFEKTCLFRLRSGPENVHPWVILVLKSLKEDDVLTLFPVVEAVLMRPTRRTQAATRASTTTVSIGIEASCQRGYR